MKLTLPLNLEETEKFDLVVFDEASQIRTHDAIGAIGRGNQVVVVGDSNQLPPTEFFRRAAGTDESETVDEDDCIELDSVLDEACASGLPEQMLGWHYRSRHEALIEFSNEHFYEKRLNVFPAARGRVPDLGVKFHLVEQGAYELGGSRTNPREAKELVECLIGQLQTNEPAARTFGVVTFSLAQQKLVEELIEEARSEHPEIEKHFAEDHPKFEKVFVKNLENVQGDERDEILFSVAYGPDEQGKMIMNFGPLNRSGGERRLNVAITRARRQLRVFSSIRGDAIDTNRTHGLGPRLLKAFLRFAAERGGPLVAAGEEASGDFDSDFERDVYDTLRTSGFRVATQVGCGGYRIDLAVLHPEQPGVYAIGIECDGAAYHSAATARDRDRLRQEVLEGLGWRLHRIWSTDWIYNRKKETERLLEAVERAIREGPCVAERAPDPAPARHGDARSLEAARSPRPASESKAKSTEDQVVPYRRAQVQVVVGDGDALYEPTCLGKLKATIGAVAKVEAPIHVDELARRVAGAFGVQRVRARARQRVVEVLDSVPGFVVVDDFVWQEGATRAPDMKVRVGYDRDPEMVPGEEIASAARIVLSKALSLSVADLVRETARVFEIQRVGANVEAAMLRGIELLAKTGRCAREGDRIVWKGEPATAYDRPGRR